ncbi:hypothetical protein HaLaN_28435, partial [Haematococcus lacustris]
MHRTWTSETSDIERSYREVGSTGPLESTGLVSNTPLMQLGPNGIEFPGAPTSNIPAVPASAPAAPLDGSMDCSALQDPPVAVPPQHGVPSMPELDLQQLDGSNGVLIGQQLAQL